MSKGNFFKYFGIIAFVAVITVVACSFGASAQAERWEYKIEHVTNDMLRGDDAFNRLGAEGWELVMRDSGDGSGVFYFKRRLL